MTAPARTTGPSPVLVRTLLALVAVDAAAPLAVLAWAGGWFSGGLPLDVSVLSTVVFTAWILSPLVAMGVGVVVTARRVRRGLVVTAVGVALLTVLTLGALVAFLTDDSSTAALIFLSLPVLQWLLVLVTLGVAAARHRWAGSRRRRPPP